MMMIVRMVLLALALLAVNIVVAFAANGDDVIAAPMLRANVSVADDVVRIGDVIDNAGAAARIAIYRAPDLGTTGSLPTAQVLNALQAHQVIGRRHPGHQGGLGHTTFARDRRQGHPVADRARAGTPQRPRRGRQYRGDLRSRRAGCPT